MNLINFTINETKRVYIQSLTSIPLSDDLLFRWRASKFPKEDAVMEGDCSNCQALLHSWYKVNNLNFCTNCNDFTPAPYADFLFNITSENNNPFYIICETIDSQGEICAYDVQVIVEDSTCCTFSVIHSVNDCARAGDVNTTRFEFDSPSYPCIAEVSKIRFTTTNPNAIRLYDEQGAVDSIIVTPYVENGKLVTEIATGWNMSGEHQIKIDFLNADLMELECSTVYHPIWITPWEDSRYSNVDIRITSNIPNPVTSSIIPSGQEFYNKLNISGLQQFGLLSDLKIIVYGGSKRPYFEPPIQDLTSLREQLSSHNVWENTHIVHEITEVTANILNNITIDTITIEQLNSWFSTHNKLYLFYFIEIINTRDNETYTCAWHNLANDVITRIPQDICPTGINTEEDCVSDDPNECCPPDNLNCYNPPCVGPECPGEVEICESCTNLPEKPTKPTKPTAPTKPTKPQIPEAPVCTECDPPIPETDEVNQENINKLNTFVQQVNSIESQNNQIETTNNIKDTHNNNVEQENQTIASGNDTIEQTNLSNKAFNDSRPEQVDDSNREQYPNGCPDCLPYTEYNVFRTDFQTDFQEYQNYPSTPIWSKCPLCPGEVDICESCADLPEKPTRPINPAGEKPTKPSIVKPNKPAPITYTDCDECNPPKPEIVQINETNRGRRDTYNSAINTVETQNNAIEQHNNDLESYNSAIVTHNQNIESANDTIETTNNSKETTNLANKAINDNRPEQVDDSNREQYPYGCPDCLPYEQYTSYQTGFRTDFNSGFTNSYVSYPDIPDYLPCLDCCQTREELIPVLGDIGDITNLKTSTSISNMIAGKDTLDTDNYDIFLNTLKTAEESVDLYNYVLSQNSTISDAELKLFLENLIDDLSGTGYIITPGMQNEDPDVIMTAFANTTKQTTTWNNFITTRPDISQTDPCDRVAVIVWKTIVELPEICESCGNMPVEPTMPTKPTLNIPTRPLPPAPPQISPPNACDICDPDDPDPVIQINIENDSRYQTFFNNVNTVKSANDALSVNHNAVENHNTQLVNDNNTKEITNLGIKNTNDSVKQSNLTAKAFNDSRPAQVDDSNREQYPNGCPDCQPYTEYTQYEVYGTDVQQYTGNFQQYPNTPDYLPCPVCCTSKEIIAGEFGNANLAQISLDHLAEAIAFIVQGEDISDTNNYISTGIFITRLLQTDFADIYLITVHGSTPSNTILGIYLQNLFGALSGDGKVLPSGVQSNDDLIIINRIKDSQKADVTWQDFVANRTDAKELNPCDKVIAITMFFTDNIGSETYPTNCYYCNPVT